MNEMRDFWRRYRRSKTAVVGLILVAFFSILAVIGPYLAPTSPYQLGTESFAVPSSSHPLGTDQLGREIYSQVLYGARTSLGIGFLAAIASTVIGVLVGAVSGYIGGRTDNVLMRVTEIFMMVPQFFLLLVLITLFGSSMFNLIVVIGLLSWPGTARLIRAEFLTLKESDFVEACRAIGASRFHIVFSEILPNASPPIIVSCSLHVGSAIIMEAGLSFLGMGAPDVISWGTVLNNAQRFITSYWHLSFFPGLFIFLTCMGLNMMGDGLNDAWNPRLKNP